MMTKTPTKKPTFIRYADGIFDTIIRISDGAGIVDLHAAGECPRGCPLCKAVR